MNSMIFGGQMTIETVPASLQVVQLILVNKLSSLTSCYESFAMSFVIPLADY
jgi:hypothetical protein